MSEGAAKLDPSTNQRPANPRSYTNDSHVATSLAQPSRTEYIVEPSLNESHVKHLRQPFTPEAVKWRADAKTPDAGGNVRCVIFIDSRLTIERLSEVDPCWTDDYTPLAASPGDPLGVRNYAPVVCALTVHGVRRHGIGQLTSTKEDGKYAKSVFSDAIKRAGVEFGVGAYLYAMPVFKVPKGECWLKDDGSVGALNREAITNLRKQYSVVVNHPKFIERFGSPIDYGDVEDDERSAVPRVESDDQDGSSDQLAFAAKPAGRPVVRAVNT